jgi:Ca-activated chloride channel family protein
MSLLSPWSLVWLAAGAAILWLYTLKPRSRRVEVSSTLLWLSALKEETARSPIQWLKRHLLLLLQLLVALLGVFALARPALVRSQPVGRTVVLAIDASASMLANDGDPAAAGLRGPPPATFTRFDEARARAAQALAQLQPGDRAIFLRAADRVEVAAQGTLPADRETLETAIRRLQVLPSSLDLPQALEVAGALARSARLGQVVLFTGGVADPGTVTHRPTVALQLVQVGKGQADNQAITQLAARRDGAGDLEVFGRLRNFSDQPAAGTLRVYVDGDLYQEQPMTLGPHETFPLVLSEFPPTASVIEARFVRRDLLALDNVATAAVTVPPVRKVLLVGGRSDQLERALRAVPGVELAKADPQTYDPKGGYDIYVFEGWFPSKAPPGHWVLIDPPTWAPGLNVAGTLGRRTIGNQEVNDAQIARVLPSPLLDGVDLTGVSITEAKKVSLPDWAEEVVSARESPLIFMGYPGPYRAVVFSFDLRSSNLFGRVGFPVLIANVVNWLTGEPTAGATGMADTGQFVPGDALLIQPLPRTTRVVVETPSKRHYEFNGNQPVRFLDTGLPGAYTVTQYAGGQQLDRRVYVASILQSENESAIADLHPRDGLQALATIGGSGAQPATIVLGPGFERVPGEWWRLLGALALAGLFAEWWWFHR